MPLTRPVAAGLHGATAAGPAELDRITPRRPGRGCPRPPPSWGPAPISLGSFPISLPSRVLPFCSPFYFACPSLFLYSVCPSLPRSLYLSLFLSLSRSVSKSVSQSVCQLASCLSPFPSPFLYPSAHLAFEFSVLRRTYAACLPILSMEYS